MDCIYIIFCTYERSAARVDGDRRSVENVQNESLDRLGTYR